MAENASEAASTRKLTRSGVTRLFTVLVNVIVVAAVFFAAGGTINVPRAWIYYGAVFAYMLVAVTVMLAFFPGVIELINERGKKKQDVKKWDKVFATVVTPLLFITPALAGLDAGRFHWSEVSGLFTIPAVVVTILAYVLTHWAMIVNRFAETGVRIQEDRHQEVVSSGPYGFIRHPFYLTWIVTQLVYPLAVGSLYAYVPSLAIVGLFVWRTAREDATLRTELPGSAEYTSRVRYRLVPGVW